MFLGHNLAWDDTKHVTQLLTEVWVGGARENFDVVRHSLISPSGLDRGETKSDTLN